MIISAHTALGFSAGILLAESGLSAIGIPAGLLVGTASHYLTDFIPHGHISVDFKHEDFHQFRLVMLDLFGGFLFFVAYSFFLYSLTPKLLVVLTTICASLITDVVNGLIQHPRTAFLNNKLFMIDQKIHKIMHWHRTRGTTRPMKWYDIWQVIIVIAGIYFPFFIGLIGG